MSYHGFYRRHYIWLDGSNVVDSLVKIEVFYCSCCLRSHALLPITVIPYLAYSVMFVASLIKDWLDKAFGDIGSLCLHYQISPKTFWRLRRRFAVCVVLACGITGAQRGMRLLASAILAGDTVRLDRLLYNYWRTTGRSFCQALPP
jgi:hypothetical protein